MKMKKIALSIAAALMIAATASPQAKPSRPIVPTSATTPAKETRVKTATMADLLKNAKPTGQKDKDGNTIYVGPRGGRFIVIKNKNGELRKKYIRKNNYK